MPLGMKCVPIEIGVCSFAQRLQKLHFLNSNAFNSKFYALVDALECVKTKPNVQNMLENIT
jgi:hypothetical protein